MIKRNTDFVEEVLELLDCANLEDKKRTLVSFLAPLSKKHLFRLGTYYHMMDEKGTQSLELTYDHQEVYLDVLKRELNQYKDMTKTDENEVKGSNPPTFNVSQAKKYSEEALKESFLSTRRTYKRSFRKKFFRRS